MAADSRPFAGRLGEWTAIAWRDALALLAGLALPAAFAPWSWWWLSVVSPAVLMALWAGTASPRQAARLGLLHGLGTFAAGTWWLVISIHGFGQAPLPVALLLLALLVLLMALYYAALGYGVRRWLPRGPGPGLLLAVPAAWTLAEWLRGWLFSGFPWLSLGFAHTDSPLAGFAPVLGVHGTSFIVLLVAAGLVVAVHRRGRWRWIALAVAALPWPAGFMLHHVAWTQPRGQAFPVAVLQGAVPQDQKWEAGNLQRTLDLYEALNTQALGARLILWPEAAIPDLVNLHPRYVARVWRDARAAGSTLVLGVVRVEEDGETYHNSLLSLADEASFYDKHHLVPFGEFFPVPQFVRHWLRMMDLPYSDFARGGAGQPPLAGGGDLLLGAGICYEDAYPSTQRSATRASGLLVNVTNDAWFGKAGARHQHFQITRFRAMESRRFMLRAANDGISAVIGPDGAVVAQAPQFEPAVLRASVQRRHGDTPWLATGNLPLLLLCAALVAVAAWRQRAAVAAGLNPPLPGA